MIQRLRAIQELLAKEAENYFLFWPIFIGIGIGIFFALNFDPTISIAITPTIILGIFVLLSRNHDMYRRISILFLMIAIGFLASYARVESTSSPKILENLEHVFLEGTVKQITFQDKAKRLLLEDLEIDDMPKETLPTYVRLTTKTNIDGIEIGDRIFTTANIMPIPKSTTIDGFNFSLYAHFKEIGGIAIAIAKIEILNKGYKTTFSNWINQIRATIAFKIESVLPDNTASVAIALIVGDASKISESDFQAIRISGIAHLIAISGLHIVTVVGITFFFLRFVLSKSESLSLNYDLKKIAAFGSILLSFCYLLISGMPISAQRAFMMSFLVLFAILIDRSSEPLRGVAIAAIIILILTPENLFGPSLQMSFAACISLIASFKWFTYVLRFLDNYSVWGKIIRYTVSVIFSTLIAGIATTPFVIYHFNQFSSYSVLTNLLAIPLADFAIMPLAALSVLLMPLHLEYVPLTLMGWVISLLLSAAHHISILPMASLYLPSFTPTGLVIIVFGILILCFLQTRIALTGFVLVAMGVFLPFTSAKPDILLEGKGKLFAININNEYYFSSTQSDRFTRKSWQQVYGIANAKPFRAIKNEYCVDDVCSFHIHDKKVDLILPSASAYECGIADLVIDLSGYKKCTNTLNITSADLKTSGVHEVWLDKNILVKNVADNLKARVWNQ